jgi:hypothetical protein
MFLFNKRIRCSVDDIVHGLYDMRNVFDKLIRIKRIIPVSILCQILREIETTEETGAKRGEWLLSAWIGGNDLFTIPQIVLPVDRVEEQNTRISPVPSRSHDHFPEFLSIDRAVYLFIEYEVEFVASHNCIHEIIRDSNGQVESRQHTFVMFAINEFDDVRVINSENTHLSSPSVTSRTGGLPDTVE